MTRHEGPVRPMLIGDEFASLVKIFADAETVQEISRQGGTASLYYVDNRDTVKDGSVINLHIRIKV